MQKFRNILFYNHNAKKQNSKLQIQLQKKCK